MKSQKSGGRRQEQDDGRRKKKNRRERKPEKFPIVGGELIVNDEALPLTRIRRMVPIFYSKVRRSLTKINCFGLDDLWRSRKKERHLHSVINSSHLTFLK